MNAYPPSPNLILLIPLVAISPTGLMLLKLANLRFTSQNGHSDRSYAKCLIPISNHDSLRAIITVGRSEEG